MTMTTDIQRKHVPLENQEYLDNWIIYDALDSTFSFHVKQFIAILLAEYSCELIFHGSLLSPSNSTLHMALYWHTCTDCCFKHNQAHQSPMQLWKANTFFINS